MPFKTVLASLCIVLLGSAGTAEQATAQPYAQQVWDQLQAAYGSVSDAGDFVLRNYIIGGLNDNRTDAWTFEFTEGRQYLITAACDEDCSDVDVTVKDEDGTVVAQDETADDVPAVLFEPEYSGKYRVEIQMYTCGRNPCYFGFGIFVR